MPGGPLLIAWLTIWHDEARGRYHRFARTDEQPRTDLFTSKTSSREYPAVATVWITV